MASQKFCWRKGDKGIWGEQIALRWLAEKNLKQISSREKILNIEIDLVAVDQWGDLHLIEVKTLFYPKPQESWISFSQVRRIQRALRYLIEKEASRFGEKRKVRAHLLVVKTYEQKIEWFSDFFTLF